MSTVTAVKKNGEIAIACDTLIKWGTEKNTAAHLVNHNKIFTFGENFIAVTGLAAGQLALQHFLSNQPKTLLLRTPQEIFLCWRDFQRALKDDYFFDPKSEEAGFETSGLDILMINPYGIFAVGAHRDVQQFKKFYAYGAGSEFALGAIFALYDDPTLNAKTLAERGIEAAAEFDDGTALPFISYHIKTASEHA